MRTSGKRRTLQPRVFPFGPKIIVEYEDRRFSDLAFPQRGKFQLMDKNCVLGWREECVGGKNTWESKKMRLGWRAKMNITGHNQAKRGDQLVRDNRSIDRVFH